MCYCLDLRRDSRMAKFLSNKLVALLIGVIQLILWVSALFTLIAPPEAVKQQLSEYNAGYIASAVIAILLFIGFSLLLILGVLKNNKTFVQVSYFFVMAVIVLLVFSILYNICTQPTQFGVSGFLSSTLIILLQILTYVVVRNYYEYLSLIEPRLAPSNQNQNVQRV